MDDLALFDTDHATSGVRDVQQTGAVGVAQHLQYPNEGKIGKVSFEHRWFSKRSGEWQQLETTP